MNTKIFILKLLKLILPNLFIFIILLTTLILYSQYRMIPDVMVGMIVTGCIAGMTGNTVAHFWDNKKDERN